MNRKEVKLKLLACIEKKIDTGEIHKYNPYPNSTLDTNEFLERVDELIYDLKHERERIVPLDEFTWSVEELVKDCYKELGVI